MTTQNSETGTAPPYNPGMSDGGYLLDANVDKALQDANYTSRNSELRGKISQAFIQPWFNQLSSGATTTVKVKEEQIDAIEQLINSEALALLERLREHNQQFNKETWSINEFIEAEKSKYAKH